MTPELLDRMEAAAKKCLKGQDSSNLDWGEFHQLFTSAGAFDLIAAHREAVADNAFLVQGVSHIAEEGHNDDCLFCGLKDKRVAYLLSNLTHPGAALLEELAQAKAERDAALAELDQVRDEHRLADTSTLEAQVNLATDIMRGTLLSVIAERDAVGNILAVIHRDGGHHTVAVGYRQSSRDAIGRWHEMMAERDDVHELLGQAQVALMAYYPNGSPSDQALGERIKKELAKHGK